MVCERLEDNEISPWWGEHIHRYEEAIKHLQSTNNVLDLACGNGFGANLLSQHTTNQVIGADLSPEAINYCSQQYTKKPNLLFQQMDGTALPFENEHFDLITSFETIEHTTQYLKMISEFHRVLKKGASLIVSTPNILINSPTGTVTNPFHTQEFNYNQLSSILTQVFETVNLMGQQYIRYENTNKFPQFIENIFYLRGIRKLPIKFQDKIMKLLINKPMYPTTADFEMTSDKNKILQSKTFFAICTK